MHARIDAITIPTRATITLALAAIGLVIVRLIQDGTRRYTFGHPHALDVAVEILLWTLFLTHAMIAVIMWLQRERWLPSDAAMFLFIGVKALLWINTATVFVGTERGVRLDTAYLYLAVAAATVHLDVRVMRRYILRTIDEREYDYDEWDGSTERRVGPPDRRRVRRSSP